MSDLRKDPTRGRWVLVRPPTADPPRPAECPFCPGNEGLTPPEIAAFRKEGSQPNGPGWSVRVVPEANPYFRIEWELVREGIGLYDRISPRGASELIVETPGHAETAATIPPAQWEQVLWMYRERIRDLKRDVNIRDILVTRYHRAPGRITHPYSRVTAIPIIFDEVRLKLNACRAHYEYKRRCLYCDIVRQEVASAERVARLTEHFVVLCPYASRVPFETWIIPREHGCTYEEALSPETAAELAGLLHGCFGAISRVLDDPPVEMVLYTAPNVGVRVLPGEWATIAEDYHWHVEIRPVHDRRAGVGGIYVNETPPDEAARRLHEGWS